MRENIHAAYKRPENVLIITVLSVIIAYASMRYSLLEASYFGVLKFVIIYQFLIIAIIVMTATIKVLLTMMNPEITKGISKNLYRTIYAIAQIALINTLVCRLFGLTEPLPILLLILAFDFVLVYGMEYCNRQNIGT
jgi:hypothetical protein